MDKTINRQNVVGLSGEVGKRISRRIKNTGEHAVAEDEPCLVDGGVICTLNEIDKARAMLVRKKGSRMIMKQHDVKLVKLCANDGFSQ